MQGARSMAATVAAAIGLLAVAALVWLATSPDGHGAPSQGVPAAPAPLAAAGDEPRQRTEAGHGAGTGQDEPAGALLRLRFVDPFHQPLPGVEVEWRDSERALRTGTADAQGRLAVPFAGSVLEFAARTGDAAATGRIDARAAPPADGPFPGEHVVVLRQDRVLRYRVVDPDGLPIADLPVRARLEQPVVGPPGADDLVLPRTGEDGTGVWRRAQLALRSGAARLWLFAAVVGAPEAGTLVELEPWPTATIEIVAPYLGSIEVALRWPDGRPWRLPAEHPCRVAVRHEGRVRAGVGRTTAVPGEDGVAVVAPVACGTRYRIDAGSAFPRPVVDGPAKPGDTVRVDLRLPAGAIVVAGRLVDARRAPVSGGVQLTATSDGASMYREPLAPFPDGRFAAALPDGFGEEARLVFRRPDGGREPGGEEAVVEPGQLQPGTNELGDVVLASAPVLCAGRVVDVLGQPSPAVTLMLEELSASARVIDLGVPVSADGRFCVRAQAMAPLYRLSVFDNATAVPVEFAPGAMQLELVVGAAGEVCATFVPEPLLPWLEYRLTPVPSPPQHDELAALVAEARTRGSLTDGPDGEPCVRWVGLRPGTYRLTIGCPGLELLWQHLVEVPAGPADDPRLRDIDLRRRGRVVRILVTDERGQPLPGPGSIVVRGPDDPEVAWHGVSTAAYAPNAAPVALSRPADLWVTAPGRRGRIVPGVFADLEIALARAPRIALELQVPERVCPTDEITAHLLLLPVGGFDPRQKIALGSRRGDAPPAPAARQPLARGRRIELAAEWTWPMRPMLRLESSGGAQQVPLRPGVIDAEDLVEGQVVELHCDLEQLRDVLDSLPR